MQNKAKTHQNNTASVSKNKTKQNRAHEKKNNLENIMKWNEIYKNVRNCLKNVLNAAKKRMPMAGYYWYYVLCVKFCCLLVLSAWTWLPCHMIYILNSSSFATEMWRALTNTLNRRSGKESEHLAVRATSAYFQLQFKKTRCRCCRLSFWNWINLQQWTDSCLLLCYT